VAPVTLMVWFGCSVLTPAFVIKGTTSIRKSYGTSVMIALAGPTPSNMAVTV